MIRESSSPRPLISLLRVAPLALLGPLAPLSAQACPDPTGDTFWKNDTLPDDPVSLTQVAVIGGLCEGEAAATIFSLSGTSPPQKIKQVSVGFGSALGGESAAVNVEIYEGPVTIDGGGFATLGTKVFDLNDATSNDAQVTATALNTINLAPFDIIVQDDFVVAVRVSINLNGSCSSGYSADLFTDAVAGCVAGKNLLDALGSGWVDPAVWDFFAGFTLCDLGAYTGNWAIRACTEDSAPAASATPRNGSGVNPNVFTSITDPAIGTTWVSLIDIATTGASLSVVKFALGGAIQLPLSFGELLCAPPLLGNNTSTGAHGIPIPNDPTLLGLTPCALGIGVFPDLSLELYNVLDLVIGI